MKDLVEKFSSFATEDAKYFNSLPPNEFGDIVADAGLLAGSNFTREEVEEMHQDILAIEFEEDFAEFASAVHEIDPAILIGTRGNNKTRPVRGS